MTTRQAYAQVEAGILRDDQLSAETVSILHRFNLDKPGTREPDKALAPLHQQALATGDRGLLLALAELSYAAAEKVRRSVKPWEPRDPRDYYLGSAVYAWLFLFGDITNSPPSSFDRRFRIACDLYNYSLGLALTLRPNTNAVVRLESGLRRLPVGEIELQLDLSKFPSGLQKSDHLLLADQFRVRGLSVRNRTPGVGAPLICVKPLDPEIHLRPSMPATIFLRGPASLAQLAAGTPLCPLELYSALDSATVEVGVSAVPLEVDLTTYRAYVMNQSRVWQYGKLDFLAPTRHISNQLLLSQPYKPDRIPVVFVHGTFSSPVTWAEMANTLIADPVLRQRYQIWNFVYGTGNPLAFSAADLRDALSARVQQLDPAGTNVLLRQMVVIGHSQGGLLAKSTAVRTGDTLFRTFTTNRLENLKLSKEEQAELRRLAFLEPLPFVKRVIFIATPHRGSYLSGSLARTLAYKLVALPHAVASRSSELIKHTEGSELGRFLGKRIPTSLDGMSPRNPGLRAMARIPVDPDVPAHSIIPVLGDGDPKASGRDGVVAYSSAHVDYAKSEFIVRSGHSCLDHPGTIQEVRRILHEHISELK